MSHLFPSSQCCRVLLIVTIRRHSPSTEVVIGACSTWSLSAGNVWGPNLPLDEHEGKVTKHECVSHTNNGDPVGPIHFAVSYLVNTSFGATDCLDFGGVPSNRVNKTRN